MGYARVVIRDYAPRGWSGPAGPVWGAVVGGAGGRGTGPGNAEPAQTQLSLRRLGLKENGLVRRLRRIDLVDPGDHATTDVHGIGVAGALHDGQRLGGADPGLAVHDD